MPVSRCGRAHRHRARRVSGQLRELGWIRALLVAGSLATGDYVSGVSDLDLVAVTDGPVSKQHVDALVALHRRLDAGEARGLDLGCQYVDEAAVADRAQEHPTWTHGRLVQRILSGVTRSGAGAARVRHVRARAGHAATRDVR